MQNHAGLKNMCKKTRETCAGQSLWGERGGRGGGGVLINISRARGGNPEDSGPVSQTKRLHKSSGTLVLGGLSEFTLV
jgi:hypothetical protein